MALTLELGKPRLETGSVDIVAGTEGVGVDSGTAAGPVP